MSFAFNKRTMYYKHLQGTSKIGFHNVALQFTVMVTVIIIAFIARNAKKKGKNKVLLKLNFIDVVKAGARVRF